MPYLFQIFHNLDIQKVNRKDLEHETRDILVELHSKDQSKMNQGWSLHDMFRIKHLFMDQYFLEPTIKRKIKTKNYNCNEERYVEHTKCLNDFYMSKLNCTFPWLKLASQSQEKCGSKHFIRDLVDLVEKISIGKYTTLLAFSVATSTIEFSSDLPLRNEIKLFPTNILKLTSGLKDLTGEPCWGIAENLFLNSTSEEN